MKDYANTELLEKFVANLQQNKRSEYTIIAYKKDVEQLLEYVKNEFGITTATEITDEQIKEYFDSLNKNSEYTPKTISRKLNSTRTFFKFLQTEGIMKHNPSSNVSHPRYESEPPRVLSQTEYMALRDAAKNDLRISSIIELLLQTGIRIGELCRIKVSDVKLDAKTPTLKVSGYSNNADREIPLNESAVNALQKYIEIRPQSKEETLFITKNGHPLLVRNIRASIDNMFKKAQITDAKVNDLRNTFIAHHISKGTNIYVLSKLVGHKRISTTEKYIGRIPTEKEDRITLSEL
jgi:site-specific recombinase XerD